ncbi:MAG: metal ABC transporter permease [Candidatus Aminicenantes bacterium]|nr:metal ABC transporter permease [Candidatus Aminicenantes bacterium]
MEAFLGYGFLQRALLAGIFIAVACALLGVFLILRRDAMIGHGMAHVTFAGIALGLLLSVVPLYTALAVTVVSVVGIIKIKKKAGLYGDTAIAIFSSAGFALGILFVSLGRSFNVDLFSYLFGDILAIGNEEVWLSVFLALVVIFVIVLNYKKLLFMTFDSESAKAAGIKVNRLDMLVGILTAVTVVLGMKVVGILLVSAMIVLPAAAGLQLAGNFKRAILLSVAVSVVSVLGGLVCSLCLDLPASGTIVFAAFIIFLLFFLIKLRRDRK